MQVKRGPQKNKILPSNLCQSKFRALIEPFRKQRNNQSSRNVSLDECNERSHKNHSHDGGCFFPIYFLGTGSASPWIIFLPTNDCSMVLNFFEKMAAVSLSVITLSTWIVSLIGPFRRHGRSLLTANSPTNRNSHLPSSCYRAASPSPPVVSDGHWEANCLLTR